MQPPYDLTPGIIQLVSSVSEQLGAVHARFLHRPAPELRKRNRIRTIHASLAIEGNTLSEEQVSAVIDDKLVLGPKKDILEVQNAIRVYAQLSGYDPLSEQDFLSAHGQLFSGLIVRPGHYRGKGVGIVKNATVAHLAPPAEQVAPLMKSLFRYLQGDELPLIKSCVFHYELEFIHPFSDGNGRMGRLWQTRILMQHHPVFETLPLETLISKNQDAYYAAFAASDKTGKSTIFIAYMLDVIDRSLQQLLAEHHTPVTDTARLRSFIDTHTQSPLPGRSICRPFVEYRRPRQAAI